MSMKRRIFTVAIVGLMLATFTSAGMAQQDAAAPDEAAPSGQTTSTPPAIAAPAAITPATLAPDYPTARDAFLKTKKFKTPAVQLARAKEFLAALVTTASARLTTLKARLTASDMPRDKIDTAAAEIDKAVRALNTLATDSASATTRADLAKVFTQAKSALQLARFTLKHQTVAFKLQHLGAVVENLQTALEQMETRLNDLKIAGALTTQAAAELAGLKSTLSTIATSQRAAGSAVDALSIDADFEATVNSAESVTAKVALSLRTIISSAQALAFEVKSLAPAPTPPGAPTTNP